MCRNLLKEMVRLSIGLFVIMGLVLNFTPNVYGQEGKKALKAKLRALRTYNISNYFPVTGGDTWRYMVTEEGVGHWDRTIRMGGTEIVNGIVTTKRYREEPELEQRGYVCMVKNQDGFVALKGYSLQEDLLSVLETYIFSPSYVYLPLKLRKGQSFTSHALTTEYDTDNLDPQYFDEMSICGRTVQLERLEDVSVPVGDFKKCLRIRYSEFNDESDGDHEAERGWLWLARGVGIVKTVETITEFNPVTNVTETRTLTTELVDYAVE